MHVLAETAGETVLATEALAPPAAAVALLRQLDEASTWRLLLQARAGRSPVREPKTCPSPGATATVTRSPQCSTPASTLSLNSSLQAIFFLAYTLRDGVTDST